MDNRQLRTAIEQVNTDLNKLTFQKYHPQIPLSQIEDIVKDAGFPPPTGWSRAIIGPQGMTATTINKSPDIFLHLSWYKMESGRFEVIAYVNTDVDIPLPDMSSKDKARAIKRANNLLYSEINHNRYHDDIPVDKIRKILDAEGFDAWKIGQGIYVGREGRVNSPIGSGAYLAMTWYKMEGSGRYEIVAYVS